MITISKTKSGTSQADKERSAAKRIVVFLFVVYVVSLFLFVMYHDLRLSTAGFNWNPRDGSLIETASDGTQTVTSGIHPEQYPSWFLAALVGTSMFLMVEVYHRYPSIGKDAECSFLKYWPWYLGNLLVGPLIAFMILLLFTNFAVNLGAGIGVGNGAGVTIDFSKAPAPVLIVLAWMLGFYSRVARKQLDQIMQNLLPDAWAATVEHLLTIRGLDSLQVNSQDSSEFTTSSDELAAWSVVQADNIGQIDVSLDGAEAIALEREKVEKTRFAAKSLSLKVTDLEDDTSPGRIIIQAQVNGQSGYKVIKVTP